MVAIEGHTMREGKGRMKCLPACCMLALRTGLRTFGSKLQAINMRAGLFVNVDEVRVG